MGHRGILDCEDVAVLMAGGDYGATGFRVARGRTMMAFLVGLGIGIAVSCGHRADAWDDRAGPGEVPQQTMDEDGSE